MLLPSSFSESISLSWISLSFTNCKIGFSGLDGKEPGISSATGENAEKPIMFLTLYLNLKLGISEPYTKQDNKRIMEGVQDKVESMEEAMTLFVQFIEERHANDTLRRID